MSKFSERFRQLKDEHEGMTLKELSLKLDITVPNLSYYMKGREPSYDVLIKIADYFDVTVDWLVGRTDTRNITHSSIIEEVENKLNLTPTENLSGDAKELYLKIQESLYESLSEVYNFYLNTDLNFCKEINIYFTVFFQAFKQFFNFLDNTSTLPLSMNSVRDFIINESTSLNIMASSFELTMHKYIEYLIETNNDQLPKDELIHLRSFLEILVINQRYYSSLNDLTQDLDDLIKKSSL